VNGCWLSTEQLRSMAYADAQYYAKLDRQLGVTRVGK
jgi:hypothetical protein